MIAVKKLSARQLACLALMLKKRVEESEAYSTAERGDQLAVSVPCVRRGVVANAH